MEAVAFEHGHVGEEALHLEDDAGLAHPCFADDADHLTLTRTGFLEGFGENGHLLGPPHEGGEAGDR